MADKIQKNVYDDVLPPRSRILNKYYFESVPVAIGVAVIVTSLLGELDMKSGFTMLGIGLTCLGIYSLRG